MEASAPSWQPRALLSFRPSLRAVPHRNRLSLRCAVPAPQYRQPDNTQMIVLFFSSSCTLQNIIIRQASLTAVVDLYGAGGNTYS